MPRQPENRVGQIINRWLIVNEQPRIYAFDKGKIRPKVRSFIIKCTQCGEELIRRYKDVYYDTVKHSCKLIEDLKWEQSLEPWLNGKHGYSIVGKNILNVLDKSFKVLNVRIPNRKRYKFKTLVYDVECNNCKTKGVITSHGLGSKKFIVCTCEENNNEPIKTKEEIVEEINKEFEFMKELARIGALTEYLRIKFPDENWDELIKEDI